MREAVPFWERVKRGSVNECWPWLAGATNGYGKLKWKGRGWLAHRKAFELAYDTVLQKEACVCHSCDNPGCCNPFHLFIGTRDDNNKDRHRKGRSRGGSHQGTKNPRAKLTESAIKDIFTSTLPPRDISEQYKIPVPYICDIRAGRAWSSVTKGLTRGHYGWRTENANARAAERVR